MMLVGLLYNEHRLIERIVPVLSRERDRLSNGGSVNSGFIESCADFLRTYADKCHHGKEEDILFNALSLKKLSRKLKNIIVKLIGEHNEARKAVNDLVKAAELMDKNKVIKCLDLLINLYPKHIEVEDKELFMQTNDYLSKREHEDLLKQGEAFDKSLIHLKYQAVIEFLEKFIP